jgi:hypothetical protein
MSTTSNYTSGTVSYVNTDKLEDKFVASSLNSIYFQSEANGVYNNATAYTVNFANNIPQMRFRSDGQWLAVRDDTNAVIYFMSQDNTGLFSVNHIVNVGSYPHSLGWCYNGDTLATGLTNGSIAVLQRNTSSNTFYVYQILNTSHTGGVSKVFGMTSRIYSLGGTDSIMQSWWLNTTTGVWSNNQTLTGVGSGTASAIHISAN